MALPNNTVSQQAFPAPIIGPKNNRISNLEDFEWGSDALNDPSSGLMSKAWRAYVENNQVWITAEGETPVSYMSGLNITEISFTFDQTMRPHVCYVQDNVSKLYWYDPLVHDMQVMIIPGALSPRISLDDKRIENISSSDIILAYTKLSNKLCMRMQRDRYTIEYVLGDADRKLHNIGMGANNRMQFEFQSL